MDLTLSLTLTERRAKAKNLRIKFIMRKVSRGKFPEESSGIAYFLLCRGQEVLFSKDLPMTTAFYYIGVPVLYFLPQWKNSCLLGVNFLLFSAERFTNIAYSAKT